MEFLEGQQKDSVEFDYVFDATQGAVSASACGRDHCWLFTENELQLFRLSGSSRGSRIFKWIFETPSGSEIAVRFVTEIEAGGQQYLLVSLEAASDAAPEMRLLDLATGQCVATLSLGHSSRAMVASAATQVPHKYATPGAAASILVGADGGCLFILDLHVEPLLRGEKAGVWRVEETLLNGEQVEKRNLFRYRERVLAQQQASITCLYCIPELSGFAVGFSFSAFQVYGRSKESATGYRLLGSSTYHGSGDAAAVTAFAYQQRLDGYLWVVQGSLPGSRTVSNASASLFRIPSRALDLGFALEDADRLYTRKFSAEVASQTAGSRLLHCETLPSREEGHSDFVLFAWEALASRQGSAQAELHLEVFSLRSSAQLDSSVPPSELECFTRFTVSDLALASGSFDVGRTFLAALVLPSSLDDYDKRYGGEKDHGENMDEDVEMHGSRDAANSISDASLSVGFDVALLSTEDVVTYRLAGAIPAALEQLASTPLDEENICDQFDACVEAGLVQSGVEGSVRVEEQWRSVLGVLLDHSMVSVICQYLVSEQHTLRPGLVYDWVQAEASEVVREYSIDAENALEKRNQAAMDMDYTRLADCFSVMRALLTLQPSSSAITSDTLRTLQFIEIHSWLSQLTVGDQDRHQLEQQCYTLAQQRKTKKKPRKLFLERIIKSLKATVVSDQGEGDAMEDDDDAYLSSASSFTYVYPVDIRRLLRKAAPEVMMTKRCLVFYYLLDLSFMDDAMANAPEEFADAFMLPNAYRKVMKSLWTLDCSDWEHYLDAAQLLSEFWTDKRRHNDTWAQEILSWAGDILSAFLEDPNYRAGHLTPKEAMEEAEREEGVDRHEPEGRLRAPLLFYYAAQPQLEEKDLEVALLAVLLGSNDPIQDAFAFQRRLLRRPLSLSQAATAKKLLFHLFEFSENRGLVDVLFLHHFDEVEERCLVEYFSANASLEGGLQGLDYLFLFYLQRCRYSEAFHMDKRLRDAGSHDPDRALLLANAKQLMQAYEESSSFARLHTAVKPVAGASSRVAKIVPGWTGPPAAANTSEQEESSFSSFAAFSSSTPSRRAPETPSTVVLRPSKQQALGTGQRINRFLQTPAHTPLAGVGMSASAQRLTRRQLSNTPFLAEKASGGSRQQAGTPLLSPFPNTPTMSYHVPFGSAPGGLTPAFERPVRPHDVISDDL